MSPSMGWIRVPWNHGAEYQKRPVSLKKGCSKIRDQRRRQSPDKKPNFMSTFWLFKVAMV